MKPLAAVLAIVGSAAALVAAAWLWAHPDPGEMVRVRRDGT